METSAYSRGRSQGGDLEDVESYPGNGFASAGRFQGGAQVGTESHRGRTALSLRGRSQVGLERDRREEFRY